MTSARVDVRPFLRQDEGQHYDRKSLFAGEPGKKAPRDRREVRDQVAKYVAAFANAEGGVLILGIEDDGEITGHGYPPDAVQAILEVPERRLRPPQPRGFTVLQEGRELLVFDVPMADVPVQVDGDGFPLRMSASTVQSSESSIQALKLRGLVESWESRPSAARLASLDTHLLGAAKIGAGLEALSDEEYLLKRRLADRRGNDLVLRRGAELLFGKDGSEHPNAGVRIFHVVGTERRLGSEHNVEERPRVEGNLASVLGEAFGVIEKMIRRPSRLVGTRFRPTPEYPDAAWKEAVLNAVAHRDYLVEGRSVEVWLFDDRLEVTSPGGLVPDVTLDELLHLDRVHVSRNPRTVRGLVDLGFMRDQGEGIPRMFAEMEALFLPAPLFDVSPREFRLTLRNTPTLTVEDRAFVAALGAEELSDTEFRALLDAHRRGRIDNARMRQISGLDTLGASQVLRRLRDRGLLSLKPAGAASYYELGPSVAELAAEAGGAAGSDAPAMKAGGFAMESGGVQPESGGAPTESARESGGALPPDVRAAIDALGGKPKPTALRRVIVRLCELRPWTPAELANLLGRNARKLSEEHLTPLTREGKLERVHPDTPAHPQQAYLARQGALNSLRDSDD